MRVLILGGTRFIGWHIASTLKSEGHRVAVFHRGLTPLRKTIEWHRANPPKLSAEEREQYRQEDDAEDQVLSQT
jgi:nucleoside-diphosphate-sugar epimerase